MTRDQIVLLRSTRAAPSYPRKETPNARATAARGRMPPTFSARGSRMKCETRNGATRRRDARARKQKNRLGGVTPGGLRVRLLMRETLRGPLGDSFLLAARGQIEARIGKQIATRKGREGVEAQEAREHATASRKRRGTAKTEDRAGARRTREIARMARLCPCEHLTENGLTRMRQRFHRVFLNGESHGAVTAAAVSRCGLQMGRVAVDRRSGRERHSD